MKAELIAPAEPALPLLTNVGDGRAGIIQAKSDQCRFVEEGDIIFRSKDVFINLSQNCMLVSQFSAKLCKVKLIRPGTEIRLTL